MSDKTLTYSDLETIVEDKLNESHPTVNLVGYHFETGSLLRRADKVIFQTEVDSYIETEIKADSLVLSPSGKYYFTLIDDDGSWALEEKREANAREAGIEASDIYRQRGGDLK